jgi:hypothetical protein
LLAQPGAGAAAALDSVTAGVDDELVSAADADVGAELALELVAAAEVVAEALATGSFLSLLHAPRVTSVNTAAASAVDRRRAVLG